MIVNYQTKELQIKIVYYGPALAGKTTNIRQVYRHVPPARRSELTVMDTLGERTLFFDYLQMELGKIGAFTPRVNLYTVPGQAIYATTRRIVLQGADAVIFVADSAPDRLQDNLLAWQQLHQQLEDLGLKDIPIVVQWNKRDLRDALPVEALRRSLGIRPGQFAEFEAVAVNNLGVRHTLERGLRSALRR